MIEVLDTFQKMTYSYGSEQSFDVYAILQENGKKQTAKIFNLHVTGPLPIDMGPDYEYTKSATLVRGDYRQRFQSNISDSGFTNKVHAAAKQWCQDYITEHGISGLQLTE